MWQFMAVSIKYNKDRYLVAWPSSAINKFIKLNYEHFHGKLLAVVAQKNIFYWSIHIIRVVICIRINISWMECIKLITTTTIFMMSLFNLAITSYLKSCSFLSLINKMNEHHQVLMEWQIVPKIYIYIIEKYLN